MIEWFDDLVLGVRFKSPEKRVTREDIKRFASDFDPQSYHLDEAAAERSVFKGLAASGWHTAAIAMRLAVETRPFGPHPLSAACLKPVSGQQGSTARLRYRRFTGAPSASQSRVQYYCVIW